VKYILALLIFLFSCQAQAETLTFEWGYDDHSSLSGYTIYRIDSGVPTSMAEVEPAARTASFEDTLTGDCNSYYIVAMAGNMISEPSNVAAWCRQDFVVPGEIVIPGKVTGLTIRVE